MYKIKIQNKEISNNKRSWGRDLGICNPDKASVQAVSIEKHLTSHKGKLGIRNRYYNTVENLSVFTEPCFMIVFATMSRFT